MAEIRCPNCGKENPSNLKVCQYCQTPLPPDSTMRIGDKPTKKNTGELEPVLPDWLRDVRQQARDSAEEDAAKADTLPKIQKAEPPDLLAGLASQSTNADDEDVPAWLAGLSPKPAQKPASPAPQPKPESDFFAQFEQASAKSQKPQEPPALTPKSEPPAASAHDRDELSEWFTKASEEHAQPFVLDSDSSELDWDFKEDVSPLSKQAPAEQPKEEEDLSWLRDLEAEAKKTGELSKPKQSDEWYANFDVPGQAGPSKEEDLSWLNDLGAIPASDQTQPKPSGPADDLSWLDDLGSVPAAEPPKPEPSKPGEDLSWLNTFAEPEKTPPAATSSASKEDLSWLNDLGRLPASEEPSHESAQPKDDLSWLAALGGVAAASRNESTQDDMSWLDELDKTSGPGQAQPASEEDLSWLHDLQGTPGALSSALPEDSPELPPAAPLSPRQTAPLGMAEPEIPDWLKSATQEPSMPLGPQALDRMREDDKKIPISQEDALSKALFGAAMMQGRDEPAASTPETPPGEAATPTPAEAAALFNEASSLFSDDLPDWLSSAQPAESQAGEELGIHAESGEALSPADLPSWVQAMRPVEAVVAGAALSAAAADQPVEREGPLAGLKGVIPIAAIGSLRRPRPIPLTLLTSEDQQASAAVLEQILLNETTPQQVAAAPSISSQRTLRWVISGLILFVLMAVLFSGTQIMPVSPVLPAEAGNVNNVVMNVADNAPVLVILDYEPSLAGEMEAVSGPVLDQLVQLHHPYLSFIATSPSGNALVERLLRSSKIDQAGYVSGQNYTNMGYLAGGESGALAFIQSPQATIPSSPVLNFSEYAAVFLLTDHSESARTWVEQFETVKQTDPTMASIPLVAVTSAQAGPMLQPYTASRQITGMLSGLPNAVRYELLNGNRPGIARTYWDAFGVGVMMAVFLIVIGSLWSVYAGIRARRAETAEE